MKSTNDHMNDINFVIAEAHLDGDGSEELIRSRLNDEIDSSILRQMDQYVDGAIRLAATLRS